MPDASAFLRAQSEHGCVQLRIWLLETIGCLWILLLEAMGSVCRCDSVSNKNDFDVCLWGFLRKLLSVFRRVAFVAFWVFSWAFTRKTFYLCWCNTCGLNLRFLICRGKIGATCHRQIFLVCALVHAWRSGPLAHPQQSVVPGTGSLNLHVSRLWRKRRWFRCGIEGTCRAS